MDNLELNELLQQRRDKLFALQAEGKNPFDQVLFDVTHHSLDITDNFAQMEGKQVRIAGRMMSRRNMGKAAFCDLQDQKGRVQVYIKGSEVSEESFADFDKKWDIGDIFGVVGEVFATQKGEISVRAREIVLLTKSLRDLPEKYHGLTDKELRYRQRHVDLIMNPEVKETFLKRTKIIKGIRSFLDGRDFIEVETPILQVEAGGANARPFETHHNTLHLDMYLRVQLELALKKLVVGGLERVYEIGRCFRNEGISTLHNPEFTMLELYQAYTDYHGMMELAESLIRKLAIDVTGSAIVDYQGTTLDFEKPFEKITMVEAVKKYAGVDFDAINSLEEAREAAKDKGVKFEKFHEKGHILNLFFEQIAEKQIIQPTFVIDHPVEISFLCKTHPDNPAYAQRFELFVLGGWELGNAYSELNDPIDQLQRFKLQDALRQAGDSEAARIDEGFMAALDMGLPPTGGLGIGIDRLTMVLTNSASIRDVLFFPHMKPISE